LYTPIKTKSEYTPSLPEYILENINTSSFYMKPKTPTPIYIALKPKPTTKYAPFDYHDQAYTIPDYWPTPPE
jgi:adenylate kinase